MSTTAAEEFLMSGGSPSAKFPVIGTTVTGKITRVGDPMQQRDITSGAPKVWDDGSPMLQLPVDVLTAERDDAIDNDDGTRTLYIKGALKKAVVDAVRRAGVKMLAVGGTLSVTYSADGEASKKGFTPPKEYTAVYNPPAAVAAAGFLDTPEPITATTAPVEPAVAFDASNLPPAIQALIAQAAAAGQPRPA